MKLYHHPLSGHSHRVRLFVSLLGLPHDLIEVDLKRPGRVDVKVPLLPTSTTTESDRNDLRQADGREQRDMTAELRAAQIANTVGQRAGIEQHQLLLEADGERRGGVEGRPEFVGRELVGGDAADRGLGRIAGRPLRVAENGRGERRRKARWWRGASLVLCLAAAGGCGDGGESGTPESRTDEMLAPAAGEPPASSSTEPAAP